MAIPQQPIDRDAPVADPELRGAWLGKSVAHANLGVDASPAGNDGTPTNVRANRVGAYFDGTAYIDATAIDLSAGGTMVAWARITNKGANRQLVDTRSTVTNRTAIGYVTGVDEIRAGHYDGTGHSKSIAAPALGAWFRAVLTWNGTTARLWVNAVEAVGTNALSWGNTTRVTIGANTGHAGLWIGDLKDVQVYVDIWTPAEVAFDYQQGVPDDSLAFWTMGGETDLSKNVLPITNWTGVTTGHNMEFHGAAAESLQMPAQVLTGGMTVSLWFNASAFASTVVFNNVEHLDRRLVIKTEAAGEMRAGYWQGAVYRPASGFGYEVGRWHHAYCTWDADETVRLWLDSTELLLGLDPSSGNALTMRLGSSTGGTGEFTGLMRDARVWLEDKGEDFGQRLYETHRRAY